MSELLPDVGVNPDWGLSEKTEFKVSTVSFGDGYEQRRPEGLNSRRRKWTLKWTNLSLDQKDVLVNFLQERKGAYSFIWQKPGDEAVRVLCESVGFTWTDYSVYSVQASIKEDFSL